jgi:hypothetical protein
LREKCDLPPSKNEGSVEEIDSQSYLFTFEDNSPSPLYDAFLSATVESFSVADDVTELSEGDSSNVFKVLDDMEEDVVIDSSMQVLYTLQELFGIDSPSYIYFSNEFIHKSGKGGLLALSLLRNATLADLIDSRDIELHYSLLDLVTTFTRDQTELFATFMEKIVLHYESLLLTERIHVNTTSTFTLSIPSSYQEIRSKYIGGVNSLWTNLPHPTIHGSKDERGNHYAWVQVKDCVGHFLASGGILISTNEMAKGTLEKRNRLLTNKQDTVVVFVQMWSDGF